MKNCPRFSIPCYSANCTDDHCAAWQPESATKMEGEPVTQPKPKDPEPNYLKIAADLDCVFLGTCDFVECGKAGKCVGVSCIHDKMICGAKECCEAGACKEGRSHIKNRGTKSAKESAEVFRANGEAKEPVKTFIPCHSGFHQIGRAGEMCLWVGKESAFRFDPHPPGVWRPFDLALALLGKKSLENSEGHVHANAEAKSLLPPEILNPTIPTLAVEWPDYGIPPLREPWWDTLAAYLAEVKGHVAIYCMGGHGRTGTAASILACKLGWVAHDACPVEWLREIYCKEVVESEEQIRYIESMTGYKVKASPAEKFGLFVYDGGWRGGRA